jgi:hypothetical protein
MISLSFYPESDASTLKSRVAVRSRSGLDTRHQTAEFAWWSSVGWHLKGRFLHQRFNVEQASFGSFQEN